MLVLSRKRGQSITIGDEIVITVVRLSRGNVQIGVAAPGHVPIFRQEIIERAIDNSNSEDADLEDDGRVQSRRKERGPLVGIRDRVVARLAATGR